MTIDHLIVARAFASRKKSVPRELVHPLLRFAPRDRTESQWRDELLRAVTRLQADQIVDADCKLVEPAELARRIGKHSAKTWAQLADKILPALALGVAANDTKAHDRLAGREAWAAAIVARTLGLWTDGAPPSLATVCDAYVWRSLGLVSKPKRCPPEIRAHFIQQRLGSDAAAPDRQVFLLAAKSVGVVRSELRVLRDALVRMWVTGDRSLHPGGGFDDMETRRMAAVPSSVDENEDFSEEIPTQVKEPVNDFVDEPTTAVSTPSDFAHQVLELSRTLREGVFGEHKVFISSVWHQLRHSPRWSTLSLDDFKSRLLRAHRAGDLVLARADLVAAMDPELVAASETRTDGASFHFIVREAS